MEEKKKKRWRPSLAAYRELEEVIHRQVMELDGWREKYRKLLGQKAGRQGKVFSEEEYNDLLSKKNTAELSNGYMEQQLESVRDANETLRELNESLCVEVDYLKNRGFWARVFNRL